MLTYMKLFPMADIQFIQIQTLTIKTIIVNPLQDHNKQFSFHWSPFFLKVR
jgi:hypothetical protein